MKTSPIVPAEITFDDGVPFAPAFGDVYHARAGAFEQAREVFLRGNGLPQRWRGRERFVILETGFGLGNNFLATWGAWRADEERPPRLVFVSIEKHPPAATDMARVHASSPEPSLAAQLTAAWPPLTHGMHTLEFEGGRVTLVLALGDVADWMPELQAQVDAVYLDGFAPARNAPMWDARALRPLARLAAPGATVATWSAARSVRDALAAAGFCAERVPGFAGKREMTVARIEDVAAGRRHGPPAGRRSMPHARCALVIGAGLAGAAAARALAQQGLQVTVLEAAGRAANAASGNPAGLFHGVVHGHDGAHAQWLRSAALRAEQIYRPLIESGEVIGEMKGLLRGASNDALADMQAIVRSQQLPPAFASALSREAAEAMAQCAVAGPAWLFPGGGWLQPAMLIRRWMSAQRISLRTDTRVASLRQVGTAWQALDADGAPLAEGDVAVVAAAGATRSLLEDHCPEAPSWPWRRTRGQLTLLDAELAAKLPRPALPLASGGYLIALPEALGGGLLCGATSQLEDDGADLRDADHRANLAQLAALTGQDIGLSFADGSLKGRVAWRLACDDRLPVVGAVPLPARLLQGAYRLEQPRHVPRVPGLYVLTGLGSRGITWAPLLGEVLAATITGAPLPVAGSQMDAIDPARFASRGARRA